jgi:hypothetical protein
MGTLYSINVFGIKKGGDIINRQVVHELLKPCIDNQASVVRIFNAVPESPSINIYVDDEPGTQDVEYKEITNYVPTRPAKRNIKIYNAQNNKLLLEIKDYETFPGQIMTLVAFGSLDNLKFMPIIDDINETIMPDQTKLRFYNLDASSITFNLTPGSISNDLTSGGSTEYTRINPGDYNLQIRLMNQNSAPINMKISLKPGRIYTLYFVGSVSPDSPEYAHNIPQVVLSVDGNTLFNKCPWS